jgi:hypothetical protein
VRLAPWILLAFCAACGGKRDDQPATAGKPAEAPADAPAAAAAVIEAPSDAECDQAIANMKVFMSEEVPGTPEDKANCLRMPRPVVVCLQTAKSVVEADGCRDRYAAAQPAGIETRPSEDDCRAAMANVQKLVPEMSGDPAQLVKDCVAMSDPAEVKCIREAKSKEELEKCDPAD